MPRPRHAHGKLTLDIKRNYLIGWKYLEKNLFSTIANKGTSHS